MSGVAGLRRGARGVGQRLEKGWGENGRREGEEVEGDEEDLVEGTEEEENSLADMGSEI